MRSIQNKQRHYEAVVMIVSTQYGLPHHYETQSPLESWPCKSASKRARASNSQHLGLLYAPRQLSRHSAFQARQACVPKAMVR